jgi:4-diphosphocytidyl-2-C-methyl-D-erythritol kinase
VVDEALGWLEQYAPARMSGTGACIFANFPSQSAATDTGQRVPHGWQWFVARRVNRSPLLTRLAGAA